MCWRNAWILYYSRLRGVLIMKVPCGNQIPRGSAEWKTPRPKLVTPQVWSCVVRGRGGFLALCALGLKNEPKGRETWPTPTDIKNNQNSLNSVQE